MPATPAAFWDGVARTYAARPVRNTDAYHHTLSRTQSYLIASDRVLEIGCGTGTTALKLAPHVGAMTATDVSGEMLAIAREKTGAGAVTFTRSAAEQVPEGAPFDAVLAFNLLHLSELDETLTAVHQALKPGGLFISKTPCLGGPLSLIFRPLVGGLRLIGKAPKVRFLTPGTLGEAIRRAGFEIVEAADHNRRPASRFIVARRV